MDRCADREIASLASVSQTARLQKVAAAETECKVPIGAPHTYPVGSFASVLSVHMVLFLFFSPFVARMECVRVCV